MLEGVESEVDVPEWRGFQDGVELLFLGATEQTNQIERERERQIEKYQQQININKIEKNGTYAWKMHEHVTCNNKNTSWAQPNPILPGHIIST